MTYTLQLRDESITATVRACHIVRYNKIGFIIITPRRYNTFVSSILSLSFRNTENIDSNLEQRPYNLFSTFDVSKSI